MPEAAVSLVDWAGICAMTAPHDRAFMAGVGRCPRLLAPPGPARHRRPGRSLPRRRVRRVHGIFDARLRFLHLGLGAAATQDDGDAPDQSSDITPSNMRPRDEADISRHRAWWSDTRIAGTLGRTVQIGHMCSKRQRARTGRFYDHPHSGSIGSASQREAV
jgi:hypothetical protein